MIRFGIIKYKYVKESTLEWFFLLKSLYCQWLFVSLQQQNPPRFPLEQRTRAGLLLFMSTLRLYTKQALSISEQIELLKSRGLNIADSSKTAKFLGEVSYFRFVQYLRPMEADKTSHQFKPNSRFEDAVALYNFDMELRDLMFKAIQRLEIALRTKIIQEFSLEHGPFWFFDTSLADDEHKFIENMNSIDRELQRSKEDFIKEHRRNYDKPIFPPAWKTLELASFGTLSKLYYNFCDKKLKKRVARQFNLPQHEVLESWMRSVTVLRNCCAHHSRLWNRYLSTAPQMSFFTWCMGEHRRCRCKQSICYSLLYCILAWFHGIRIGLQEQAQILTRFLFTGRSDSYGFSWKLDFRAPMEITLQTQKQVSLSAVNFSLSTAF